MQKYWHKTWPTWANKTLQQWMKFPTSLTPSIPESHPCFRQQDKHASTYIHFRAVQKYALGCSSHSLTVVVSTKLSLSRSLTNSETLIWLPSCPWAKEVLLPPTLPACISLSLSLSLTLMLPRLTTDRVLKVQLNFMRFVCSGSWRMSWHYSRERDHDRWED